MASRISVNKNKKGYEIFSFTFPYDPAIIQKIRDTFASYNFNKSFKCWEIPAFIENYPKLKAILPEPLIVDDYFQNWYTSKLIENETQQATYKELIAKISNYTFKTKPYEHQKKGFIFCVKNQSGALLIDCGLGKTFIMLNYIQFLLQNNVISKILIIMPLSVIYTWRNEIPKHTDIKESDYEILVKYPIETRKKMLNESRKKIYLLNYDCVADMQNEIVNKNFDMIVCDESTMIKSIKAGRTKSMLELVEGIGKIKTGDKVEHKRIGKPIKYRWALTGTPISQRVTDIYTQIKLVAPNEFKESFWAFRNRYCRLGGFKGYEIVGLQNIDELEKRIAKCAIVFKKEDCLDLPEKSYQTKSIELSTEQKKHYKELVENLVTMMGQSKVEATIIIAQMTKLSQITSGFMVDTEGKTIRIKDNAKIKVLLETLDELSGKTIIWARFKEDVKLISEHLQPNTFVTFTGETSEKDRETALTSFKDNPIVNILIITSAGGYGLNLAHASNLIYYSHEFSVEKRQQSEDRCHRIGTTGTVTIISLVGTDTIDEYVVECCQQKRDVAEGILNNINRIINPWIKKDLTTV